LVIIKQQIKMKNTFFLLLITLFSCSDFTDSRHFYIDPHLKIFANRFFAEGAKRNKDVNKDMTMVLTDDLNTFYTGIYGLTVYELSEIKIDKRFTLETLSMKDHFDSLNVEFIVFHEMGHFLLHRAHAPYNTYSIMVPDGQYMYDYQTDPNKRKILIDELFK